jgi:hypothetical protein
MWVPRLGRYKMGIGSRRLLELVIKEKRRAGLIITVWWVFWKEGNKRIFEHKEASALQLASTIQEVISLQ